MVCLRDQVHVRWDMGVTGTSQVCGVCGCMYVRIHVFVTGVCVCV